MNALPDRYRRGNVVRETALTTVRHGRDEHLDRDVFIAELRREHSDDAAARALFRARFAVGAELVHRNIGTVYDLGSGEAWAALEPLDLPTVDEYCSRVIAAPDGWADAVLQIATQLADAMQYAHGLGVLHGDLGPRTVVVRDRAGAAPEATVMDFGPQPADFLDPEHPELAASMWALHVAGLEHPPATPGRAVAPTRRADIRGYGLVLGGLLQMIPRADAAGADSPVGMAVDVAEELRLVADQASASVPTARQESFERIREQLRWISTAAQLDRAEPSTHADDTVVGLALPAVTAAAAPPTELIRTIRPGRPAARRRPATAAARLFGIGLVVVVLITAGAAWFGTHPRDSTGTAVTIPTVVGTKPGRASDILSALDLVVAGQRQTTDATIAPGLVVGTDPTVGSRLPAASPVTLLVSAGPDLASVPQLQGLSLSQARDAIAAAGLSAGAVTKRNGLTPVGTVLSSSPAFGVRAERGSAVAVVVASGNQTVPQGLIGQPTASAVAALSAAGFAVQTITEYRSDGPDDVVLSVDLAPGSSAPLGSMVTLTVSWVTHPPPLAPSPSAASPASSPDAPAANG